MALLQWAQPKPRRSQWQLSESRPIYVISDLHLGDGTRSDAFMAKDRELLAFLRHVQERDGFLVVAGDAVDFSQAWTFARILRAHEEVLRTLSEMARAERMVYIYGNHDYDLRFFESILNFPVVSSVEIGDRGRILHGYEFDPVIGPDLEGSEFNTVVHHLVERLLNTWLRPPLEFFYTRSNRLAYWGARRLILSARSLFKVTSWLGWRAPAEGLDQTVRYWLANQLGNPSSLARPAMQALGESSDELLICGHSHLPGVVEIEGGKRFVNTGSWTFRSAQYLLLEGDKVEVRDWISGREFKDELYAPLMSGLLDRMDYDRWWRSEYMGWLRFRSGEERMRNRLPWKERSRIQESSQGRAP